MSRKLPATASVALPQEGARLHAPSAERNAPLIAEFLRLHGPQSGTALEIASGTGQHVVAYAATLPDLHWHPTDIEPARLRSIDAHVADAGLKNVAGAEFLDAAVAGWGAKTRGRDLIVLVNLLHLIPDEEARTILAEASRALAPNGTFVLYGPFRRDGTLTSAGDQRFDAELRAADPAIGYKDTEVVAGWLADGGLTDISLHDMPANNLIFLARKPSP